MALRTRPPRSGAGPPLPPRQSPATCIRGILPLHAQCGKLVWLQREQNIVALPLQRRPEHTPRFADAV